MMAEARREEEEEEEEEEDGGEERRTDLQDGGQTTDHPPRTKPEHFHVRQGPLSSIRTAIKRTRTISQCDNPRERRRPEITIVSAEPLASNDWFSRPSGVFPPPPPQSGIQVLSQPPPSYDQVIKEKTQEHHIVKPTAAPRQTTCTTTTATQTDSVEEDSTTPTDTTPPPAESRPAGKQPKKPPRPLLPKAIDKEPSTEKGENVAANTEDQHDSHHDLKLLDKADSSPTCTRSVVVHWDIPSTHRAASAPPTENTSENGQRPVPRPRTKLHKQVTEAEVKVETLAKQSEGFDDNESDSQEASPNKYLTEILEVFCGSNTCEEKTGIVDQSDEKPQGEDAVGEMSSNSSQRNIRARIQAFESQASTEEGNVSGSAKPDPLPRRTASKPQVAAKPSLALKSHSADDDNQNVPTTQNPQNPTPVSRPVPPRKPVGLSVREELENLHSKGTVPQRSRPSVLTRANSIHQEELSPIPPIPPAKPPKEPLKPNLNTNNHNSASVVRENEYVDSQSSHVPVKPQHDVDSSGGSFNRKSGAQRPTTIRVPSKTGSISDHFQDGPPPLPVQKPVGSLNTSVTHKQSLTPTPFFQSSYAVGPEPSLPPRKPSVNKTQPPRPPPAKTGPGRPPPPSFQTTGPAQSASRQRSPKPQAQKPHRKGLVLPPRPRPGHRLYNKYTLQLPHGIAAFDYHGVNTGELSFQKNEVILLLEETNHNEFEGQAGEIRGRVHKSHMKIITPLGTDFSTPQDAGPASSSGGDGCGLKVKALHDFIQEGPGELSLRAGDVVTGVEQVDSQWYRGTCRGSTGFFPVSYVKVLTNSPKPLPERNPKVKPAPVSGPRCVARFDFEGEHSDELTFSEGDVIQLRDYVGEDWARGQMGVSVGIFPLNFVEIVEDLPPSHQQQSSRIALPGMVAASPSTHPEAAKPAQAATSSVKWVVALYDYAAQSEDELSFQQGDYILITKHINEEWSCGRLRGRGGMFPSAFVQTTSGLDLSSNQQNGAAGARRAKALYSFTSDCDEELSLQAGDIITNLESIDEEWFLGDLRGKRALVPKNYVQVLE